MTGGIGNPAAGERMTDEADDAQARPRNMSFKSPEYISEVDGFLLAVILRLIVTELPYYKRSPYTGVSLLTKDNMEHVVPYYAYFKHKSTKEGARTREELADIMKNMGHVELEQWVANNAEAISIARHQLGGLFDVPGGRPGFSCYDG